MVESTNSNDKIEPLNYKDICEAQKLIIESRENFYASLGSIYGLQIRIDKSLKKNEYYLCVSEKMANEIKKYSKKVK